MVTMTYIKNNENVYGHFVWGIYDRMYKIS